MFFCFSSISSFCLFSVQVCDRGERLRMVVSSSVLVLFFSMGISGRTRSNDFGSSLRSNSPSCKLTNVCRIKDVFL